MLYNLIYTLCTPAFEQVQLLKPGGILVYSTCTLAPDENEGQVAYALSTYGDQVHGAVLRCYEPLREKSDRL